MFPATPAAKANVRSYASSERADHSASIPPEREIAISRLYPAAGGSHRGPVVGAATAPSGAATGASSHRVSSHRADGMLSFGPRRARRPPAPVGAKQPRPSRACRPPARPSAVHSQTGGKTRTDQRLQETGAASSARRISAAINGQTERSRLKCRRHRAGCPGRASWLPVYCGNSSSKSPSMTYAARRDRKFGPDTGRSRHSGRSYRADRSANCLSQGRVRVGFRAELT